MRMLFMMYGFAGALNAKPSDRMYNVLPLYHSAGGVCAVGVALHGRRLAGDPPQILGTNSGTIAQISPTFFQYIGELCRYLLNAPPDPHERAHVFAPSRATACGPKSGPLPGAFRDSQDHRVLRRHRRQCLDAELRRQGRRGGPRAGLHAQDHHHAHRALRYRARMPVRGSRRFLHRMRPAKWARRSARSPNEPGKNFEGYTQGRDTEKKILRDVFEKGDAWFRTGDLMRATSTAISISSTASATPSAGRARTSPPAKWPKRSAS
jgi:fatty-acyl-CoA synthase